MILPFASENLSLSNGVSWSNCALEIVGSTVGMNAPLPISMIFPPEIENRDLSAGDKLSKSGFVSVGATVATKALAAGFAAGVALAGADLIGMAALAAGL